MENQGIGRHSHKISSESATENIRQFIQPNIWDMLRKEHYLESVVCVYLYCLQNKKKCLLKAYCPTFFALLTHKKRES